MNLKMKSPYMIGVVAIAALIIGLGIGYVMLGDVGSSTRVAVDNAADRGKPKAIILLDDKCEVCNKDLNNVVSFLEANTNFNSIQQEYVHVNSKRGEEIYQKLLDENVNIVPLIVFEGDVADTDFYRTFDKVSGDASKYIIKMGNYHILMPGWSTRIQDPNQQSEGIVVYFSTDIGRDNVERFMYQVVPTADLELKETNEDYMLRFEASENVIEILKRIFLAPEVDGNTLTVPYVNVDFSAQKDFLSTIGQSMGQMAPNVMIKSVEELNANTQYLAIVETDNPEAIRDVLSEWKQEGNKFVIMKSEKPKVELFVMSYCPYGLQAEKAIVPVLRLLGDNIDFKLRFVDYAMHGEKEVWENLRQHCIQLKEDRNTFIDYIQCFAEKGNEEECMSELNIDKNSIQECLDAEAEKYGIQKLLNDKSTWRGPFPQFPVDGALNEKYGVQGSPTLVIDGIVMPTPRNPEDLKNLICGAILHPPEDCNTELPSENASPSFGEGYTDAESAGQCG